MYFQYSKQSCVTEDPLIPRWIMAIFQNQLNYLGKKKKKSKHHRNFIPEGGNPHFPSHIYSAQLPWPACVSNSKCLWWLPGSLSPQVKEWGESRWEWSILWPSHVLGLAPTHKGTTWPQLIKCSHNSCPSALQATNLVTLEWRLPPSSTKHQDKHIPHI